MNVTQTEKIVFSTFTETEVQANWACPVQRRERRRHFQCFFLSSYIKGVSVIAQHAKHPAPVKPVSGKRETIMNAALRAFSERGVNGVAVPEIADLAGVGTGTIYRYFQNKEALVNELYRHEKEEFGQHLIRDINREGAPRERFAEFWRRMVSFARLRPHAFRFLELQDHLPYLEAESRKTERQVLVPMKEVCHEWQKRGVFRSDTRPEILMALIWGAFVNLFKAERAGYLTLTQADIDAARDACWTMCAQGR